MNSSEREFYDKPYSHIYIESEALNYEMTSDILNHFPNSEVHVIHHYKDIFNRSHQNFMLQKRCQALILAVNHGELLYPGARVCQSFGNEHFYYTSNIMNCIYDCDYCYLQGMYPSGNMVIFVNTEDYFKKTEELLKKHSVYLCISYDTDLLAFDKLTGLVQKWTDFTASHEGLKIEIRTKSAAFNEKTNYIKSKNIIFAWTFSPNEITNRFEHYTPSLDARIQSAENAIHMGYTVRLCFDPMIYVPEYKTIYSNMYRTVFERINPDSILDVSIGLFRISAEYMKSMRKKRSCEITEYPYTNINGVCSYEKQRSDEMLAFARSELLKYLEESKIYDS